VDRDHPVVLGEHHGIREPDISGSYDDDLHCCSCSLPTWRQRRELTPAGARRTVSIRGERKRAQQ
ncbi:MAG: hypothetical protein WC580_05935, partial [Agrococcus sp.]